MADRRKFIKSSFYGMGGFLIGSTAQCSYNARREVSFKKDTSPIKAFNIDFNWGEGGAHGFAAPGLWAEADPAAHVQWYEDLGCNTIHSFGVSCNGYAWYKNGIVPEQPGLKHDFLPETVRLAKGKNMKTFAYFCVGANNRWEENHPDEVYQMDGQQIPFTNRYNDYLCSTIEDVIRKSDVDGIMLDWFCNPGGGRDPLPSFRWLPSEQVMYKELMGEVFPGKEKINAEIELEFRKKAIDRLWKGIREAVRSTKPNCLIWLTCYELNSKELIGSNLLNEVDWLMNEAGDVVRTEAARNIIQQNTRLITCLANWNKQNPIELIPYAIEKGIGLYGFTKPTSGSIMPPVQTYLDRPIESFEGDARNIAALARTFNDLPFDYVSK